MIIGSQAIFRTKNIKDLSISIDQMNIPTFLTGMARGLLGDNHPLYLRHNRNKALSEADLVIIAGMPMDFRLDYGRSINKDAILITLIKNRQ